MSEKIGKLIASRLKAMGKGQAWLAEKAEVSVNAVSKWTKTGKIARERVAHVAELLGVSVDELVSGEIKLEPAPSSFMDLRVVSAEEMRLLTAFRLADERGRDQLNSAVDAVLNRLEQARRHKG